VLEQVHGIINAVSWGLLLPLGVMAARYLRRFSGANPWWFYIHVTCQCLGYLLGVVGWALGIKLENYNKSTVHYKHRNLGIAIFTLATLQV
jgi:protein-S-isoprenylcysteine O-methyltransferase Ste14